MGNTIVLTGGTCILYLLRGECGVSGECDGWPTSSRVDAKLTLSNPQ